MISAGDCGGVVTLLTSMLLLVPTLPAVARLLLALLQKHGSVLICFDSFLNCNRDVKIH